MSGSRHAFRLGSIAGAIGVSLLLAGCAVGPHYSRPTATAPTQFKETPANWKAAEPADSVLRGKWWEIYQDPQLNALEEKINVSNQTLKSAQDQFLQARALVRENRASYFPTISAGGTASRNRLSSNRAISTVPRQRTTRISICRLMSPTNPTCGGGLAARSRRRASRPKQAPPIWKM